MASPAFAMGERTFGQTWAVRIGWGVVFLGTAAILAAIALDDPKAPDRVLLYIAAGLVVGFVILCILIGQTVLTIRPEGVRVVSVLGEKQLLWTEIAETRYVVQPINLAAHFGLVGLLISSMKKEKSVNLSLQLIGRDGKKLKVTSNFKDGKEAIAIILSKLVPPKVADTIARLKRSETVVFGPVSLAPAGVIWKSKTTIPFAEIAAAELAGTSLRVKRQGKWLDAISVRSDKVPDVLVFLEALEAFAPAMKGPEVNPLARVRF
jgi:hypothetical protein